MFRWYQRSSQCYVLLTDVSIPEGETNPEYKDEQIRQSRWFTRGWTLQELLAPSSVRFYSREGHYLGSKLSLEKLLADITGIPISALRGTPLRYFPVKERLSWSAKRETKIVEDRVYSLLGIFGVHITAMYGEGEKHALLRLESQIEAASRQSHPTEKPSKAGPKWIVPLDRNRRFTGRESEIQQLQMMLFPSDHFAKAAVSGLGGMGKTQLVLELLYRLQKIHGNCTGIWLQATSLESLDQGYYAAAQQLGLEPSGEKGTDVKKLVQDYLSKEAAGQWVLIYDNADDISMWFGDSTEPGKEQPNRLIDYIPKSNLGRVIFTTRDRKAAVDLAEDNVLELAEMAEEPALQMFRNSLVRKDLLSSTPTDTKKLLAWLTYLPLAISQAAAYMNQKGLTPTRYLALLEAQEQNTIELLTRGFANDARSLHSKNPVATTWLVSFRQIQQCDPLAADYLSFMACVDDKDVPQILLPPGPSQISETDAIGTLTAYSFVTERPEARALDMHRLVHLTIRNWLRNEGVLAEWAGRCVARLEETFPDHEHSNRMVWRRYLPHARYILDSGLFEKNNASKINLKWKMALCYLNDGRLSEAEVLFRDVMEFRLQTLGPEHPDSLRCTAKLALVHHTFSRFQQSMDLGVKAMEAQKRVLGEENPETLTAMSELAMTYSDLSRWKEAEKLELEALEIRSRVLGRNHPDTLVGMSNLVYMYNCQGWWEKAEELGKQTTASRKKILGPDHPHTLLSIGNLAHTYNNQGRYTDAETLLAQVVDTRVKILGRTHPHTLSGMSNLAVSYHNQDRLDESEALQAEVAEIRKEVLGPEHFSTLTSMAHLSSTYHRQGRSAEAKALGLEVLELRRKVLGPEHHHTLTSMASLASIYSDAGRFAEAEDLWLQALSIRIRTLGMDHQHTLTCMEQVADTYGKQGRCRESEELKMQVAELRAVKV